MLSSCCAIVWLRRDLRLADNPALVAAIERGSPVVPLFIWPPDETGKWAPGAASRVFLHQALASLDNDLRRLGSRLTLRTGPALETLRSLLHETGATAVYWNRLYEPDASRRDKQVKDSLAADGIDARSFQAGLLIEPWELRSSTGGPFQIFTPFYKRCLLEYRHCPPLAAPPAIPAPESWPEPRPLAGLGLLPDIPWHEPLIASWDASETGAHARLAGFGGAGAGEYADQRDFLAADGTSKLSPYLHWGLLSPRQAYAAVEAGAYRRQLWWREFAHHLLFHFPHTSDAPLRADFARFPWRDDGAALRAWQRGRTGYPLIDAAIRQLWQTGWMHNRARMATASFLVKHLLQPWQAGAQWFWDTLVDADLANNTFGWQWTVGCGADAAPYFRIFNPVIQGKKFDPEGAYVRRFVPELAALPAKWIHEPWNAPPLELQRAGVRLGETYPHPLVDHSFARDRALAALASIK